eukprot:3361038-Pleurochrysis_carterae.AAC.1
MAVAPGPTAASGVTLGPRAALPPRHAVSRAVPLLFGARMLESYLSTYSGTYQHCVTAPTSGPPSRRLRSTGHVPDLYGLLATVIHANDFDDNYLLLAKSSYTTAANAFDVLPPPKHYTDIHGRPDEEEEEWRAACVEEFKNKVANDTFDLVKCPKNTLTASGSSPTSSTTTALSKNARLAGSSAAIRGFSPRPEVYFDKTLNATAKAIFIHIFFALVALCDLELKGIDVVKAFTRPLRKQCSARPKFSVSRWKALKSTTRRHTSLAASQLGLPEELWLHAVLGRTMPLHPETRRLVSPSHRLDRQPRRRLSQQGRTPLRPVCNRLRQAFQEQNLRLCPQVHRPQDHERLPCTHARSQTLLIEKMADRFLPNKTLRISTTTLAWFTEKAQRVGTFSKLGIRTNKSDSAIKQDMLYLELVASILYAAMMTRPNTSQHTCMFLPLYA